MVKTALRFLIVVVVTMLIGTIITSLIGLIARWTTVVQFSNAFFFAGVILIGIGFVNVIGMRYQDTNTTRQTNQVVENNLENQFKLLRADISRGYYKMAFFGTAGLLMFGVSWLVLKVF
jgi:hypothetical protein